MKNLILILITSSIFAACDQAKRINKEENKTVINKGIIVTNFNNYRENALTNISDIQLNKNILTIKVSYSGGCKEHEFSLLGSSILTKSLPPKRNILLFHKNNNDNCRELITENLMFDISEFSYADGKEIQLMLKNWEKPISYLPH